MINCKYIEFAKNEENLICITSPTMMHRAMWRVVKGKKLEVAMKVLKSDESKYTKEFLELTDKWRQLRFGRSSQIIWHNSSSDRIGMLLELVKLGPLDKYLRSNSSQSIKTVDLVEAGTCLATALWHLEDNHVIHGRIRCEKLLVHAHTDNSFIVKLADPGLYAYIGYRPSTTIIWRPQRAVFKRTHGRWPQPFGKYSPKELLHLYIR